jgi:hypothetical protein
LELPILLAARRSPRARHETLDTAPDRKAASEAAEPMANMSRAFKDAA